MKMTNPGQGRIWSLSVSDVKPQTRAGAVSATDYFPGLHPPGGGRGRLDDDRSA